jgi:NADH-quinone oxidoreductase subunit J
VGEQIAFVIASVAALGFGVGVIGLRKPFQAAVCLIGSLLSVAALFVLLAAPFLAAIQIIVYAGAIVVLFLFVIAYLGDRPIPDVGDPMARYDVIGWISVAGLVGMGAVVLGMSRLPGLRDRPADLDEPIGGPTVIGRVFLDEFIVPFEATSLVLLVAALAAVLLAQRSVRGEGGR